MSRFWKVAGTAMLVGLVALTSVGAVFAQGQGQGKPTTGEGFGVKGQGRPTAGEGLGVNRQVDRPEDGYGVFAVEQEVLHAALADALGISLETLEGALEQGETLYTLAVTYGVDFDSLLAVMDDVHAQALADAVAEGNLTQEQADWMLERVSTRSSGQGNNTTMNGMRGNGQGRMSGTGECLSE